MLRLMWVCLLTATSLAACKSKPKDPRAEVEAAIAALEKAVGESDLGAIKSRLTDDYKDDHGQDKKSTVSMLQLQFLKQKAVYTMVRIQDITLSSPTRAVSELLVAAAATPIKDVSVLEGLRADLLHLDITWQKDGDEWHVQRSKWRSADLTDFLE